jgi:hypothetical protein
MATLYQLQEGLVKANRSGNTDAVEQLGEAIRQHPTFQKESQRKLEKGFTALSGDEKKQQIAKHTARALGLKESKVDAYKGMGGWGRFKLGMLRDEESKAEQLEKLYGRENLNVVNIGGKQHMLYRDEAETENKWRRVDEQGASFADLADVSGAVLPTAAAVGGAIGAVALTGATGGLAVPLIAAGGAALGGFGGGVAQDVASEVATGQDVDLGDIAGRRGKEALLGVPIDLATAGIGRLGAKALGKRMITKSAAEAKSALSDLLEKTGGDRGMLDVIPTSDKSAAARLSRLAKESEGLEASRAGRIHDQVDKIVEAAKGRVATDVPVEDVIMREADALRATMKQRKDEIARLKIEEATAKRAATGEKKVLTAGARQKLEREGAEEAASQEKIIDATIDRLIKKQLKGAERLRTTTGESIRKSVLAGKVKDEKIVDDLYAEAERVMKAPIYKLRDQHSLVPIAKAYDRVMKKYNITDPADDYSYRLLEARLGQTVANDLVTLQADLAAGRTVNFSKLNSMTRRLANQVNRKKTAGFTEDERIINDLARSMQKTRDAALDKIGATAAGAWKKANAEYRQRILPRTENITDRAQRSIAGGSDVAISPEKLADEALSSSQAIRQTIRSAENPNEMRKLLRGHYMSRIIDEAGDKTIKIDMDEIRPLFLKNADARAAADRLREINSLIKNRKINPRSITAADVEAVVGDPLTPSGKKAMELLKRRGAIEEAQGRETFKSLQKMAKGQQPIPEDIHAFVDEFVRLDARDMKQLLDRLPDEPSRNSLRRSALDHLLQSNEAGGQAGSRRAGSKIIFNPDTMFETLRKNEGKWRTALGGETYDDMIKSAKVLKATPIPKPTVDEYGRTIVPKADIGGGGGLIFYATGPVRWLGRKTMDILHGSGKISTMLESITASREVDEELFKKIILSSMATRRGMEAVADEADKDKNFEDWLNKEIYGTEPDEE